MFCEAIATIAGLGRRGRATDGPPGRGAGASAPSLYASVWRCPECRTTLRLYASVQQIVTGAVNNDCPDCGQEMDAAAAVPHAATSAAVRRPVLAAAAPSAFAA